MDMDIDIIMAIAAIGCGYLIGTIPTAYLALRISKGRDIRQEGSKNVGARNFYELTGNTGFAILVGFIDGLKGVLAVLLGTLLDGEGFLGPGLAGIFAVAGHNFNAFLGFAGGRGLATAAGVAVAINPLPLFLFILMYLTGYYVIRRDIQIANVIGALGCGTLMVGAPEELINLGQMVPLEHSSQLKTMFIIIAIQIVMRHIGPIRERMARKEARQHNNGEAS